jgi:hypothetical protein
MMSLYATAVSRSVACSATVPGGSAPSAPMLTTTATRNSTHQPNPGGSRNGRPAARRRSSRNSIGTAIIAKIRTPSPSAHQSG